MSITSFSFLCLFAVSLLLYYAVPQKAQWGFLLLLSIGYFLTSDGVKAGGWYLIFYPLAAVAAVYFAALFWMADQGKEQAFLLFAGIFYLSRILSGFAAVNFRGARKNGMLYTFTSVTDRYRVNALLGIQFVICLVGMGLVDIYKTGAVFLAAGLVLCYYRHMAYKEFGGVTGDLAGYFLCVSELCMTVVLACVNIL